ncbi:MAG: isopeptide-forming domain-containing fimbrial protein [[Clostridium] innocuum]
MVRGMKRLMAFFVVFTLLFQMTDMPLHAENSRDVSALLTVKEAYIEQNHKDVVENSMLTDTDPVSVSVNFKVPVLGDGLTEEDSYVRKGDTAVIELATKYKLADTASPSFALTRKVEENGGSREVKIGSLRIVTDTDANKVYAHIVFDGDDEVFDGQPIAGGGAWSNVNCKFSTTLEYNGTGDGAKPGEHAVTILGKSFSVKVPEPPVIMTMEKSGAVEGKFVSWKVKIDAQQAGAAADFGGYVFQDNLKSVGSYVDRSFKIGTAEDGSDAVEREVSYEASLLQHTFPESAKGICYVFFKTEIPDAIYYANSEKTIRNTAVILKDEEQVSTSSASVNYDGTWIKKELNGINHKDGTISWTITANQPAASLTNAVITDKLDSKLNWQSAALEIYNGTSWDAGSASFSNEPADGKYEIGTINAKVRLTITAQLKDKSEIEHTVVSVNNKATLSWEGNTGVGSNSVYSSIGFNPITKTKGASMMRLHIRRPGM